MTQNLVVILKQCFKNKFGGIKEIVVYLYSKTNQMKVKSISLMDEDKSDKIVRMYIFHSNETVMQNFFNRFDRPNKAYYDTIIPMVLEKLKMEFPEFYKQVKNDKWRWSQYAGCKCGCSPGFVGQAKIGKSIGVNI